MANSICTKYKTCELACELTCELTCELACELLSGKTVHNLFEIIEINVLNLEYLSLSKCFLINLVIIYSKTAKTLV